MEVRLEDLARKEEDLDKLVKIYKELEFRSFIDKLHASSVAPKIDNAPKIPSLFDLPEENSAEKQIESAGALTGYEVAETVAEISDAVSLALKSKLIGISLHSTCPEAMTAKLTGMSLSVAQGSAVYIPLPEEPNARKEIKKLIEQLFVNDSAVLISHDLKRDYIILKNEGIPFAANCYDTSVAHYLLQPEMRHDLSLLASTCLGYAMTYAEADSRKGKLDLDYSDNDEKMRLCERADVTLRLYNVLKPLLSNEGLDSLMNEIELPFIKVLAEMEHVGVRIDVKELSELSSSLTSRVTLMEQQVYDLAGETFNISSPMQVGEVLFGKLKIDPKAKRSSKGYFSTAEEILEKYRAYPIVDLILNIRGLRKLLATYINALPGLINPLTGKIHTSYNQTVTATGRISSTNPNLQNIPIRTDDGREIRRAFIADPWDLILSADYSQIELRLMAEMSGDEAMIEAFLSGEDIHRATAAKIYKVALEDVTDTQRQHAKTANFGIIYGISPYGLSVRLGISRSEAKSLIDGYFESYPEVKEYMSKSIDKARDLKYVTTIKGRKRRLPDIASHNASVRGYAERNAINAPIQGSAADIIKIAMINIMRDFDKKGLRSRMIMQVHDELVFNVIPDELDAVKEIVVRDMEGAYVGSVPLMVSVGVGKNWLEAH